MVSNHTLLVQQLKLGFEPLFRVWDAIVSNHTLLVQQLKHFNFHGLFSHRVSFKSYIAGSATETKQRLEHPLLRLCFKSYIAGSATETKLD